MDEVDYHAWENHQKPILEYNLSFVFSSQSSENT